MRRDIEADMRTIFTSLLVALSISLGMLAAPAQTAPPPSIELTGGSAPVKLTLEELAKLPQVEQEVTFKTSKGMSTALYKGPLLWDVLKAGKALDGLEHNKELAKTLLISANDDYQIAFSVGELSPEFGNATILLALETDGKPLPRGFQIVAQGDERGARAVHDIVKIEVR